MLSALALAVSLATASPSAAHPPAAYLRIDTPAAPCDKIQSILDAAKHPPEGAAVVHYVAGTDTAAVATVAAAVQREAPEWVVFFYRGQGAVVIGFDRSTCSGFRAQLNLDEAMMLIAMLPQPGKAE
jgi:hypothetical protein